MNELQEINLFQTKQTSSDGNITITDENYSDKGVDINNILDEVETNHKESKFSTGRWTQEEHVKFVEAMFLYGNEWKRVQEYIKTRSSTQARSHAQKFFIRLKKKLLEEHFECELKDKSVNKRNELIISWIQENVNSEIIKRISNREDSMYIEKRDKLCKIIMNILTNPIKRKTPKVTLIKNCCALRGTNNKECKQICCIDESEFIKEYDRRKGSSTYSNIQDDNEIFRIEKINKDYYSSRERPVVNQNNYYNIVTINLNKDEEFRINDIRINKSKLHTEDDKNDPFKLSFCESPLIKDDDLDINLNFDLEQFFSVDNFLN
jgi:SHAQKYF class myb-like DNA-binding protein